ncbi:MULTISPECIES: hypothetical protein [unclassified Microcoleus]|uniref:hypothetical protein n=1 Tax=unclassified Microcoleus TaxID=2642155 RepID=UPI0025D848A7|nr:MULTISPECIES: hypothetical protein [unclassified Microcoleus]
MFLGYLCTSPNSRGLKPLPSGRLRSERSLNLGSYHFAVNCQLSTVNCLTIPKAGITSQCCDR